MPVPGAVLDARNKWPIWSNLYDQCCPEENAVTCLALWERETATQWCSVSWKQTVLCCPATSEVHKSSRSVCGSPAWPLGLQRHTDMHTIRHRHVINTHIHHDTEPQATAKSQSTVALFKPQSELPRMNCKDVNKEVRNADVNIRTDVLMLRSLSVGQLMTQFTQLTSATSKKHPDSLSFYK